MGVEKGQKIYLADGGFEFLEETLTRIYGDRGTFKHNIVRYYQSDFFRSGCRTVESLEKIPELTEVQIRNLIKREKHFKEVAKKVCEQYDSLTQNGRKQLSDQEYYDIAGIFGVAPSQRDLCDTLFPNLLDLCFSCEKEANEIHNAANAHKRDIAFMVNRLMDGIRNGQIYRFRNRDVFSQGYARNFYRGENAYNKTGKPGMYRGRPAKKEEADLQEIILLVKEIEFLCWLNELSFVANWPYGNVNGVATAQHYGFRTTAMDVTSDLKIALFFACCRYDNNEKKWLPLTEADFLLPNSRQNIADRGGDSRYGMLFCAPADIENMCQFDKEKAEHIGNRSHFNLERMCVEPVGYQPFMRCPRQSGYMIFGSPYYDMYQDISFTKIKFRHTEDLCNWIYEEMDEGREVYPSEGAVDCSPVVERIKRSRLITEKSFEEAVKAKRLNGGQEIIRKQLIDKGFCFTDSVSWCSDEEIQEINEAWRKVVYPELSNVQALIRPGFSM